MDDLRIVTRHDGQPVQVNLRANHEALLACLEQMVGGEEFMNALTYGAHPMVVAMMIQDAAGQFTARFGALLVLGVLMNRHKSEPKN